MAFEFKKATKEQSKLRLAIFGPSGAGKTFSALRIATGMGGNIAVIDTERGSASKYADRFEFDVLDLPKRDINTYIAAIDAAASADYPILIIDSLSHAWQELLEEVDKIAKAKFRGNRWSAWSEGTPKQRRLVDALLNYPGHIIATMRSKTEWVAEQNSNGKTAPRRVGMAPEQGKGIEYEFDLLLELSVEHIGTVIKDRTGKFQDEMIEEPGEPFGVELERWLHSGEAPKRKPQAPPAPEPEPEPEPEPDESHGDAWALYSAAKKSAEDVGLTVDSLPGDMPLDLVRSATKSVETAKRGVSQGKPVEAAQNWLNTEFSALNVVYKERVS